MASTSDWTVLMIGGPSAAGKSTLGRSLAARLGARYIDLDLFWIVLHRTLLAEAAPALHRLDGDAVWMKEPERLVAHFLEVSRFVCRAIEPVVAHHHIIGERVVMEGCWVLPSFAQQRIYAGEDVADSARALFLREPDIGLIEARIRERPRRWLETLSPVAQRNHLEMQRLYGETIATQAENLGLPVVDSQPFETLEARALAVLGTGTS